MFRMVRSTPSFPAETVQTEYGLGEYATLAFTHPTEVQESSERIPDSWSASSQDVTMLSVSRLRRSDIPNFMETVHGPEESTGATLPPVFRRTARFTSLCHRTNSLGGRIFPNARILLFFFDGTYPAIAIVISLIRLVDGCSLEFFIHVVIHHPCPAFLSDS